jgi:hypothetical protein
LAGALAAGICLAALAGCGGRGHSLKSAGRDAASIPLSTFNCAQWLTASARVRKVVLQELRGFYGGPISGKRRTAGYGTVLSDAQATRLFDSYCARPFARDFTLYKLYARAAAFAGSAP